MQELIDFVKNYPIQRFEKDQVIFSAGESTDVIYVVSSGFAKVITTDMSGSEQLLWLAGRLDIIPSEQLFRKTATLVFSYAAHSDLVTYKVSRSDFIEFANNSPTVMREIARGMSGHYDDVLYRLSSITQASAREKLIYTLVNIVERFSAEDEVDLTKIGLVITHQDIAGLTHTTRETASIELKKLKDSNLIYYDRSQFVIYLSRLRDMLPAIN